MSVQGENNQNNKLGSFVKKLNNHRGMEKDSHRQTQTVLYRTQITADYHD